MPVGNLIANILFNLYGEGLLGGLPAEERKTKLAMLKTQRAGLEQLGEISRKPIWSKLPPGMEREAAGGLLPGQRREEMVGPTYGEMGALGGIAKDLPISQLISAKAGPKMMKPWLGKLMAPGEVEEATAGAMFPSPEHRRLQDFERVIKEPGVLSEQKKGLEDIAKIAFGYMEKERQPVGYTLSPGQERYVGEKKIAGVAPTQKEEKARTDFRFFVDEYREEFPDAGIEEILEAWKDKGVKDQANKGLLLNYTRSINQTLKKYGIQSGLSMKTLPDGTMSFSMGNKESIYQALEKKAAEGHIRAAEDLEKINYWYDEIDKLMGVPGEITGRPEEERELDATDPMRIR